MSGIAVAVPLHAAPPGKCEPRRFAPALQRWPSPLDRPLTLGPRRLPLKQALDEIAAVAQLRVSYSPEQLPLERVVCIAYSNVALGDVLAHLLKGISVQAVLARANHIVLTPVTADRHTGVSVGESRTVYPLEPVIATANAHALALQRPAHAVTVIEHDQITHEASVGDVLRNAAGVWTWQSPVGFTAQYTTRGATSFGVSSPKIYIDGIEVANPLLAAQVLPENIERIEVIRGPQGGALYGADAMDGVTNIVTRHETAEDGAPRMRVRTGFSVSTSDFIRQAGLGQDHLVSMQLGSAARSGGINIGVASVGEYMPGSYARSVNLDGSLRVTGEKTLLSGSARFYSKSAGNPAGVITDVPLNGASLSMQQYTLGAKLLYQQSERVTHSLVIGADGYLLNGFADDSANTRSVADSVLRAAGDGAIRTTLRLSSVAQWQRGNIASAVLTLAAEHSSLQQRGALIRPHDQSRMSNGISAQVDGELFARLFVSGGLRLQRDDVNGSAAVSTLPMLGAAYVIGGEAASLKLRTAYGKAIRWPTLSLDARGWYARPRPLVFSREQQSGLEAGVDITLRRAFAMQLTRYDQVASGPIGDIANNGWELQATLRRGALSLGSSMALVNSRVLHVAPDYTGELRAGDRMLTVPARTASVQAAWQGASWSTSLSAARAFDWINYDRLALAQQNGEVDGIGLREFWHHYSGATQMRATFTRELNHRFTMLLTGDNLLDRQTGEPDNLTVVPGRTVSFGVRAAF
ncbi:MAG: TonB-dependent receptor plug domain-containing protein [Gemmatimonadota bacterium]